MASPSETSWYTTMRTPQAAEGDLFRGGLGVAAFVVLMVALSMLRYASAWISTDLLTIHSVAMEALLAGDNWGRQALFASPEFPPLAMLGVLAAKWASAPWDLEAGPLLCAVCQVWAFLYLVRVPQSWRGRGLVVIAVLAACLTPYGVGVLIRPDPNWVVAVPMAGILFHLTHWEKGASLRDIVGVAIGLGALVFCGVAGLSLALALTAAAAAEVATHPDLARQDRHGTLWLIASPVLYGVALILLFNWLVMGEPLVPFRMLSPDGSHGSIRVDWISSLRAVPAWVVPLAVALVLVARFRRFGLPACVLVSLAVIPLTGAVARMGGIFPSGVRIAQLLLGAAGVGSVLAAWGHAERHRWRDLGIAGALALTAALALMRPADPGSPMDRALFAAPTATEVLSRVDRNWQDSRVLVYGVRAPAAYPDPEQRRFIASVDYHLPIMLDRAEDEQVHVLLPPETWRQPAFGDEPPDTIRRKGSRHLLLETVWPSGWQLWRCVIPPKGESHLPGVD